MANNQKADLSDVILRRTKLLEKLFLDCDMPIRIIGDVEKPAFVYDEVAFLSIHVQNFELHFRLDPDDGKDLAVVKLRQRHGMDHKKFMDLLRHASHRAVIKVRLDDCPLCVSGYNFLDRDNSQGRYPVFARYGHKVYFNALYVKDLVAELNADGYRVNSWIPYLDHEKTNLNIIVSHSE